jgi:hypothetical protein
VWPKELGSSPIVTNKDIELLAMWKSRAAYGRDSQSKYRRWRIGRKKEYYENFILIGKSQDFEPPTLIRYSIRYGGGNMQASKTLVFFVCRTQ